MATIDFITLLPYAACLGIAALVFLVLDRLAASGARAEERLAEIRDPSRRRTQAERQGKTTDAMVKMLERASPTLAKPLRPKNTNEASKLKKKLMYAGFRSDAAASVFLGLKFIGLAIGLVLSGGTLLFLTGFEFSTMARAVVFVGVMFYLPDIVIWFIGKRRKEAIFLSMPDVLDLMVVCVEAGLGLDQAMRKVALEMKETYRAICEEIALCNFQLQMGRPRTEVLHDLGQRTGVDDVRALASILIQAEKFGTGIGQALRAQSDSMRTRRRQLAEERAAKTAVKLIFPLVIFIFPGIFVVLVGPAAITMVNSLLPSMGGG